MYALIVALACCISLKVTCPDVDAVEPSCTTKVREYFEISGTKCPGWWTCVPDDSPKDQCPTMLCPVQMPLEGCKKISVYQPYFDYNGIKCPGCSKVFCEQ